MEKPLISVILPVYNAENTISDAIKSVIDQTYDNWELIIINDGSSDDTETLINSFNDRRIKYFKNKTNKKIIYSLNKGLELATGKYVARMDSDDICKSSRFEQQVNYLESHPDVIICGTQIHYFGSTHRSFKKLKFPSDDKSLKLMLASSTCFAHPTVIIRRDILITSGIKYDERFINAEDYSLWIDLMGFGKYANLQDKLLYYRISDTQISQPSNPQTLESVLKCREKYASVYLPELYVKQLFYGKINCKIIEKIRQIVEHPKIIESCYLSLENIGKKDILYYIKTGDIKRLGYKTFLRICKRIIKGYCPIYYHLN